MPMTIHSVVIRPQEVKKIFKMNHLRETAVPDKYRKQIMNRINMLVNHGMNRITSRLIIDYRRLINLTVIQRKIQMFPLQK